MNALSRWNQLRQFEALQQDLGSLYTRSPSPWTDGREEPLTVAEWAPRVDIAEDAKEYLIQADLPQVKQEDIKVTAVDGTLTITGERRIASEEQGRKFHRVERSYGRFERNFSIPDDASADHVTVDFKDGVLNVHLAKTERPKPQQIDVKVT